MRIAYTVRSSDKHEQAFAAALFDGYVTTFPAPWDNVEIVNPQATGISISSYTLIPIWIQATFATSEERKKRRIPRQTGPRTTRKGGVRPGWELSGRLRR